MNGEGGSYVIDKKGSKPRLVARTQDQADGNRPRAADGTPLDVVPDTQAKADAPAPAQPKE